MRSIRTRLKKIEEKIGKDDGPWLCLPDPDNPGKMIELRGIRNFAELAARAHRAKKQQRI